MIAPALPKSATTLWIDIGEDDDGYTISRPATVDEEHAAWVAERSPWDARAQAADDRWSDPQNAGTQ